MVRSDGSGTDRRTFLKGALMGAAAFSLGASGLRPLLAASGGPSRKENLLSPIPTASQLAWHDAELSMFVHFGMNTFTDHEWGDGTEDPRLFNPARLDCRQWVACAKDAGFRYVILTAKHHDGFCLWPSRYTDHCVRNSPWRGGHGDVVREFAAACHEAGVKMGLYLSPWDRNSRYYGDSPTYNRYYVGQLTELLTRYGDVAEVWFDGACGEGPNGRKQEYDWPAFFGAVRRLQPGAVMFGGPDLRWVGNEDGYAAETEWCVRDPDPVAHAGAKGKVWYPAECDTSIRPGWFWHAAEDSKVKTLPHLMDIYYRSVGRNCVLLLNVPPNRDGLFSAPDVQRLKEFRACLNRSFRADLALHRSATADSFRDDGPAAFAVDGRPDTCWRADRVPATLEVDLGRPVTFNVAMTMEFIQEGQYVSGYQIAAFTGGQWQEVSHGTTIGHKKLDRFTPVTASRVRLRVTDSLDAPRIRSFGMFNAPEPR